MIKYVLSIGLNDKNTKKQEIETKMAWDKIINILQNNYIEGATVYEAKGIYKLESENTARVEILDFEGNAYNKIIGAIKDLKIELNQECIALETVETNSVLL